MSEAETLNASAETVPNANPETGEVTEVFDPTTPTAAEGVIAALMKADPIGTKAAVTNAYSYMTKEAYQEPPAKEENHGAGPTEEYLTAELDGARVRLKAHVGLMNGERTNGTIVPTFPKQIDTLLRLQREVERNAKRLVRFKANAAFEAGLKAAEASAVGQGMRGMLTIARYRADNAIHPNDRRAARQEIVKLTRELEIEEA
ncbi:MAG: hypothetical protein ACHQ2Y_10025 [Candidatus Lutacidiplasmatales archaeon]